MPWGMALCARPPSPSCRVRYWRQRWSRSTSSSGRPATSTSPSCALRRANCASCRPCSDPSASAPRRPASRRWMQCAICGARMVAARLRQHRPGLCRAGWKRQVKAPDGGVDSLGYRLCLLDSMRAAIRRRDLFASPSLRYADPRVGLLAGPAWEAARPSICRTLGLSTDAGAEILRLSERLDAAYRATAANLPENASVQIDGGELVLSALDKLDEPPSLVALRKAVDARMPRVDLPELLLEMHARTGFAAGFTHASEGGARAGGIATSLCAVLLAEACNTGFEPLIRRDNPALRRSRLSWVRQNHIRAETLTRANAALVASQNRIPLARAWGGGDVASADGLRFVVPVRTIHSGPNPKYYGQERGVTFYNLV